MFNFLKKNKTKTIKSDGSFKYFDWSEEERKNANFWINEQIERCKKFDIDLTKYIKPDAHPIKAKWIATSLIDGINEKFVFKMSRVEYEDENQMIDLHEKYTNQIDEDYYVKFFKPDNIKQIENNKNYFIGAILGDICGSAWEFVEHEFDGNLLTVASDFTDDSVLTMATYFAIKEDRQNPDFSKWYKKMFEKYPYKGYGSGFIRWASTYKDNGYGSFANGSAMRVSPVAVMYDNIEDVIRYAVRSAQVTHNHIDGVKGAVVTAVCIYMARNGYTKEEIKGYLDKHYKYNKDQLSELSEGKLFYLIDSQNNFKTDHSLYCNFAVPYAIDMFLKTDNFEECMAAIVENFGDTDTVCAIVGSVCFAYYKLDYKAYAEVFETYLPEEFLNEIR